MSQHSVCILLPSVAICEKLEPCRRSEVPGKMKKKLAHREGRTRSLQIALIT